MKTKRFNDIAIVGVGLLGGSLGLAVKAVNHSARIVGVGHRLSSLNEALAAGAVDEVSLDLPQAVREVSLVVLCTPVGTFASLLKTMAPALRRGTVVIDVGSTKAAAVRSAARYLGDRVAFVGCHPIAGGEQRGVAFARTDLYAGKTCVLTPTPATPKAAVKRVEGFWQELGMHTVRLSPAAHDRVLARVSHLPHALAALLVNVQSSPDLDLAGTGFIDSTRIAGGDPAIWRDIFLTNRKAIDRSLKTFERHLGRLRQVLARGDAPGLEKLFAQAQARRGEMLAKRLRLRRLEE
jgi:prephenate dehydrogenase